jgi:hypothetical protein
MRLTIRARARIWESNRHRVPPTRRDPLPEMAIPALRDGIPIDNILFDSAYASRRKDGVVGRATLTTPLVSSSSTWMMTKTWTIELLRPQKTLNLHTTVICDAS